MALSKQDKEVMIEQVCAMVAQAKAIVVAEYRGLDVESVTRLRRQARGQGVQLRVLKNTLARRAMTGTPFSVLADHLVGPLVYGMGPDPVAVAKVLSAFAKDNEKLVVKAGAMANFVMDEKAVKAGAADGDHAGDDSAVRAHAQRGSCQVGPHAGSGARCPSGGSVIRGPKRNNA